MIKTWKNNLLNLPDSIFFEIMRNYLGDLKTPFNKHDLMRSLATLVSRKEIRDQIFSLIDDDDSRLLTAIALLNASAIDELYEFTKQYYSFLELHNRIANLQERLLICIEDRRLIKINPIFEEELRSGYLDSSRIFSSLSVTETSGTPWLNEQLLSAFISFVSSNKNILSKNGNSRKKAESRFASIFPSLVKIDHSDPIVFLVNVLETLGFISSTETDMKLNIHKIESFGQYSIDERTILIAAAAAAAYQENIHPEIEAVAAFMSTLFNSLKPGSRLHKHDLNSFFYLIKRKSETRLTGKLNNELLIEALSFCGFIIKDDDFRQFDPGKSYISDEKLRIQSNFEISAPAGFPFADEITAAICSEIVNYDITRTYELKKTSYAAALDSGLKPEKILPGLKETSTGEIPQNLLFSLKAWEKEYYSINLNYGIVMTVDKSRLPLIQHSPTLREFITASPAPGVFILDPEKEQLWRKAFAEAGFDMLPKIVSVHPKEENEGPPINDFKYSISDDSVETFRGNFKPQTEAVITAMNEKISRMSIPAEHKQKLEARSRKKLILSESQLKTSNKPEERGEAGGLDHRAKIRLTERALELDNLLEVTTARDLELEKRLIKPLKLSKSESETPGKPPVFFISGIELPDETELQIPITRISYLKMLKSSLFTP